MAMIDLKHLYKARTLTLSISQRRLLNAISKEPAAHLYSKEYMARHQLTSGGIASGLRTLMKRALVGLEDGEWRVQPPEMRKWLEVLHDRGPAVAENFRWWETEGDGDSLFAKINKANVDGLDQEEQARLKNIRRHQRILKAKEAGEMTAAEAFADLYGTLSPEAGKTWLADSRIVDHPTLEELASKITPENKHDYADTDFGKPVGKEKL
jgi:hypothetical protein